MEQKRCENCDRELIKREDEYPSVFRKRRFCSVICAGIATQEKRRQIRDEASAQA